VAEERPGLVVLRATGDGAVAAFERESGGHRHQRVPPTEKRGRVHTSTVTVAVLPVPTASSLAIAERDLRWTACRASGSGGQHLQKTDSAVQITHLPTGLQVRCESERSQHQNRQTALAILRARLLEAQRDAADRDRNRARPDQVGSGQRGDKVRTYRHQDGVVTDHRSGRRARLDRVLAGVLDDLA
jgi:peptide chain release factor 1